MCVQPLLARHVRNAASSGFGARRASFVPVTARGISAPAGVSDRMALRMRQDRGKLDLRSLLHGELMRVVGTSVFEAVIVFFSYLSLGCCSLVTLGLRY